MYKTIQKLRHCVQLSGGFEIHLLLVRCFACKYTGLQSHLTRRFEPLNFILIINNVNRSKISDKTLLIHKKELIKKNSYFFAILIEFKMESIFSHIDSLRIFNDHVLAGSNDLLKRAAYFSESFFNYSINNQIQKL